MDVTREQLTAALEDEEPMFAVIEMLDKTGSYATGKPSQPDDYAAKLLKHVAHQQKIAQRAGESWIADTELAVIARTVADLDRISDTVPGLACGSVWRVLHYLAGRYGFTLDEAED